MFEGESDFFFYFMHWVFVIFAILFSWRRSQNFLHPHFIFTLMLIVLISDFLVRGYEDKNWNYIARSDLHGYQLIVLMTLWATVFLNSLVRSERLESNLKNIRINLDIDYKRKKVLFVFGLIILAIESYVRLSVVDWSISEVVRQSLSARGQRDWDQASFSGNYIFTIERYLFQLSPIIFAYLLVFSKKTTRFFSFLSFVLIVVILVTNGSRTPVTISLAVLTVFSLIKYTKLVYRLAILIVVFSVWAALLSTITIYRAEGYVSARNSRSSDFELNYHQDDSYYRAISSYAYSDYTGESWDTLFFIAAIASNPIPRAIWQSKPLFDEEFYGGYKLTYVTISYLGEIVAMAGVDLSILFSITVAHLLYRILFASQRLLLYPLGLGSYLLVALYIYMCIRSLANLTMYIYLPIFSVVMVMIIHKIKNKSPLY